MDTTPTLYTPTSNLDYSNDKVLRTLKATIAPDATNDEFQMFVSFCQSTGLNPYKKEIWFIKTRGYRNKAGFDVPGRVQMMVGINGFYAIANENTQYDGMEEITFEYYDDETIKSARCVVWRKDRRFPSVGVARWEEYFPGVTDKKNSVWETKPHVMISKCAEAIALRKAFPQQLNGMYVPEEMEREEIDITQEKDPHKTFEKIDALVGTTEIQSGNPVWESYEFRYHLPTKKAGWNMEQVREQLKQKGFYFNGEDKHWYGNLEFKQLEQYLRPLKPVDVEAPAEELPPMVDVDFQDGDFGVNV